MTDTVISKQEKDVFLKPQSRFIGDAYLQIPSQNRNISQHRLYNHSKSLIQDIFNVIALNKEYFTMIDGILCYFGNTQIIKILLSIIQCDHKFRLESRQQNNINSYINHNYYKYDIVDSENYIDFFNDLSRNFSDENNTEISKDDIIKTIYFHINNALFTDIHSQILQLLTKFKSCLNHSIINHQTQFEFIEWLLLIISDIYHCSSIIEPIFDFQNNKPQSTDIILSSITKHDLISSIDKYDTNYCIKYNEENDNTLRIRLYCTQQQWIKVDITFIYEQHDETIENIGEESYTNEKHKNVLISVQNRNNNENILKYYARDDTVMLECIMHHIVHIFVGILIPHKLRDWNDLWIMINGYIEQHIIDIQQRSSKDELRIIDNNYLYNIIDKYRIPICSIHKQITFETISMTDDHYCNILNNECILLSFGELKAIAQRETDNILSKTKEFVSQYSLKAKKWIRLNINEYWIRFGAEKHEFIVLPKLVHRFKSHIRSLMLKANEEKCKISDDLVMTAIGLQSLKQLHKAQHREEQKKERKRNIDGNVYDFIDEKESQVPMMIADIGYYNTCFAFHCTTASNIQSILAQGLKKGGDIIESTGEQIAISHGARWGTGVYLSCDYTLARYYAGTDYHERQNVLVNLVHLGKVHELTTQEVNAVCAFNTKKYSYHSNKHQYQPCTLPCWQSTPGIDGVYKCGANTHLSPDRKQIICGSSQQILPVLLSTIQMRNDADCEGWKYGMKTRSLRSVYADSKEYQWLSNSIGRKRNKKSKNMKQKRPKRKSIAFKKLCDLTAISDADDHKRSKVVNVHDDLWTITLNEQVLADVGIISDFKIAGVKLLFGIDLCQPIKTYTKRVLPACAQIYRDLLPEAAGAVFFGDDIEYEPLGSITTASKFLSESFIKKPLQQKRNVLGCFEKLLDVICKDYTKYRSEEKWDSYTEAKDDLYEGYLTNVDLKQYNKDRAIKSKNQLCKSMVYAMMSQAVNIGKLSMERRKYSLLKREMNEKYDKLQQKKDNIYVVVLFVSGNDTKHSKECMEEFFKQFKFILAGIKVIVKIVALNKSNDNYYAPLRLKYLLQTVSMYEAKPIYYAHKKKLLSVIAKQVITDIKLLSNTSNIHLKLAHNECILDEGFVSNISKSPEFNISTRLPPNGDYTILYRGRVPSAIWINDVYNVYCDECNGNINDQDYENVLMMIQQMVSDLKIAVLAKRNVNAAVKILNYIISVIKNPDLSECTEMNVQKRILKMKRKKQLISDLENVLNDITFIVSYSKTKENITSKVEWISKIKKMKYGRKTIKRAIKYRDKELSVKHVLNELLRIKQKYYLWNNNEGIEGSVIEDEYKQDEGSNSNCDIDIIKSISSKRSSFTHLLDIFESLDVLIADEMHLNFVDLLYGLGVVGIGIRVRRSEAANIDPWNINIEYISCFYNDSVSTMCALDSGLNVFETKNGIMMRVNDDEKAEYIPDVLMILNRMQFKKEYFQNHLLMDLMRSDLYSIYLATVFTRNPNIVIPSQKIAILMIGFVESVQQIFESVQHKDENQIKRLINHTLNIMYCIRLWIGKIDENTDGYWYNLIHKLYQDNPGRFMTNSQNENVSSVCKVLAAICCFDESQKLFAQHQIVYKKKCRDTTDTYDEVRQCQLSKIAIALMGESTSRECRILVRNDADKMWRLIGKCLDIKMSVNDENQYNKWYNDGKIQKGILFDDSFNLEKATKKSSKFFNYKLRTNCTPHGIVACLGFTKCLYKFIHNKREIKSIWDILICDDLKIQNDLINFLYLKFKNKKITMKSFIKHYLPNCNPLYVQIALYIQGLRYHTTKTRRNGLPQLIDPLPIINKISCGYRQHSFEEYIKKRNKEMRAKLEKEARFSRQKRLILEQNEFLLNHSYPHVPKIFTFAEIKILNKSRDINDELELVQYNMGLLKHHCCFPKCEYFLMNLATEKDKIMNTRHGIWNHLRYLQIPDKTYYLKGCHRNAYKVLRSDFCGKEEFKIKMKTLYKTHTSISSTHFDQTFDAIYDSFPKI